MFTYCRDDINLVKQLVKKFATLTFATNVGPNTSHVVTGEGKRTLNLLKGLLQGCWIVSKVKYCFAAQLLFRSNGLIVHTGLGPGLPGGRPLGEGGALRDGQLQSCRAEYTTGESSKQGTVQIRTLQRWNVRFYFLLTDWVFVFRAWLSLHQPRL